MSKNRLKTNLIYLLIPLMLACSIFGGGNSYPTEQPATDWEQIDQTATPDPNAPFIIYADGEMMALKDSGILDEISRLSGVTIEQYEKSPAIIRDHIANLKTISTPAQAYWVSNESWLPSLGNKYASFFKTVPVLAMDAQQAQSLGWDLTNNHISITQLVDAFNKTCIATPAFSNGDPGAATYVAMMTYFSKEPVLSAASLELGGSTLTQVQAIADNICKSPDSITTLKQMILTDRLSETYAIDGALMWESSWAQINAKLIAAGKQPLYAFYISDAMIISRFPIRLVDESPHRVAQWEKIIKVMKSDAIQHRIAEELGFRTQFAGTMLDEVPPILNESLGFRNVNFMPITLPPYNIYKQALDIFTSGFKVDEVEISCGDVSGSMDDKYLATPFYDHEWQRIPQYDPNVEYKVSGRRQLDEAYYTWLTPSISTAYSLQSGPNDFRVVYLYSGSVNLIGTAKGSEFDSEKKDEQGNPLTQSEVLRDDILSHPTGGNTAMMKCVEKAFDYALENFDPEKSYSLSVLSDGWASDADRIDDFVEWYFSLPEELRIPIYGIAIGGIDITNHVALLYEANPTPTEREILEAESLTNPLVLLIHKTGGILYDGRSTPNEPFKLIEAVQQAVGNQ